MKAGTFAGSPSGLLVPTEFGQLAFVPHPLPPSIDLAALAIPLQAASVAIGELNGIGRILPDPYLLIRPLQAREAIASSSMEGTFTTVDELLLAEAGFEAAAPTSDTREVANYRRALVEAIESLEALPLSIRTLRNAHRTLLTGVRHHRGGAVEPGELKRHQNFIGAYRIEDARFIPPPPRQSEDCLADLERYLHRETDEGIPDLIDAALIHYQFETIHPFADGNGRLGRMLIVLHLRMRGVIKTPLLYPSPVFEKDKDKYIDLMFEVSRTGAWQDWIMFFLNCITRAANDAIETAEALLAVQRDYKDKVRGIGRSANLLTIIDFLFRRPAVSIPELAEHLGVTYRAAQLNVETLVRAGILNEVPTTSNPKLFLARGILDAISRR